MASGASASPTPDALRPAGPLVEPCATPISSVVAMQGVSVQLYRRGTVEHVTDEAPEDPRRRDGGLSIRALAAASGVSPSTAYRDLVAAPERAPAEDGTIRVGWTVGIDGKRRPNRRFDTSSRDALIRDMRSRGASVRTIAEAAGCSVGTVHRIIGTATPDHDEAEEPTREHEEHRLKHVPDDHHDRPPFTASSR